MATQKTNVDNVTNFAALFYSNGKLNFESQEDVLQVRRIQKILVKLNKKFSDKPSRLQVENELAKFITPKNGSCFLSAEVFCHQHLKTLLTISLSSHYLGLPLEKHFEDIEHCLSTMLQLAMSWATTCRSSMLMTPHFLKYLRQSPKAL